MIKIDNENIVAYDIDDTIVMWTHLFDRQHSDIIEGEALPFLDPYDNSINYLHPHKKHIALMKKHKGRGKFIIVWSAAGVKWAESVIKTLGLEDYVDLITTKPNTYVDDLPGNEILGTRIYLKD